MQQRSWLITVYWLTVIALFGGAMYLVAFRTPDEATMGPVQKIFYLHLPVAINTLLGCLIVFVASVGYLWQRKGGWDDLAASAAKVTVVLCTVVLLTGMIWGRGAWGRWWAWNPRLTFSLVLWLLYAGYLVARHSIDSASRRAVVAAVYGIIAFLDVPLVYLSACMIPELHPVPVELDSSMKLALAAMFIPVTLSSLGLIAMRYLVARDRATGTERVERCRNESGDQLELVEALLPGTMRTEASHD
jgi:heme exporter protein C